MKEAPPYPTAPQTLSARLIQFARFCFVGGTVLGIDFALIWFFCHFLPRLVAVSLAYILAVMTHFLLNKLWVFQVGRAITQQQIGGYLVGVASCWFSTVSIVWLALHTVTDQVLLAKAIAVPPTTLLSYCFLRFYVFHSRHSHQP